MLQENKIVLLNKLMKRFQTKRFTGFDILLWNLQIFYDNRSLVVWLNIEVPLKSLGNVIFELTTAFT